MLAGAAGGFAMMNYAWLDMGGGAFTWLAGLSLVLMFLIIGFDLFFQICYTEAGALQGFLRYGIRNDCGRIVYNKGEHYEQENFEITRK